MAFDILIIVIVVVAGITGYIKGILGQAGQIAGVIAGVVCARLFGPILAGWFASDGAAPTAFESVSGFTVAFLVAYLAVWLVIRAMRAVIRAMHLGIIDRIAGAIFKIGLWSLLLSVALNLYAAATNDVELLDGDPDRPWRTAIVRLAPVTLGYIGREALNNIYPTDVFNIDRQQSDDLDNE